MILVVGGAFIAFSLSIAVWAVFTYHKSTQPVALEPEPATSVERVVVTASASPRPLTPILTPTSRPVTTSPLNWNDLTLLLRTGFSDAEVIKDAADKQLTFVVGPEQERLLRGLGAGNPLVAYLKSLPVYRSDPAKSTVRTSATPMPVMAIATLARAAAAPVALTTSAVDYAARDRQIASLKQRIDQLDEDVRIVRTNPQTSPYRWRYQWHGNRVDQITYDAYLRRLDDERNDLRRQKWQLEGR